MDERWKTVESSLPALPSDNARVERARAGDAEAAEQLIRKYYPLVCAKSRPYFLVGADRDDLLQEGMIGLYKAVRDYRADKRSSFSTFADLCITRQMLTAIKSSNRQKHWPLNASISLDKPLFEGAEGRTLLDALPGRLEDDPQARALQRERAAELAQRISGALSAFEKEVLALYLDGKAYEDIALLLGRRVKAVDNALQRIKRKLVSPSGTPA